MMRPDTRAFPLVFLREADAGPAGGPPEQVLELLLERGEAFVLLTDHLPGAHAEESHEERRHKALFFKRNKARMRALCRGLVLITGGRVLAAPLRLAAAGAGKALGLPIAFVAGEEDGIVQARAWLAGSERPVG